MKKMLTVILAVALCIALTVPAFAATFVPSISYKLAPTVDSAVMGGEDIKTCIVVTSVIEAEDKTTDVDQEARDLLLNVYNQLEKGSMKLPINGGYVIRDLVDVNFTNACINSNVNHDELLDKKGATIKVTFDLGVAADEKIAVLSYNDGKWVEPVSVKNNGDGTITCEFEHFCPVAFVSLEKNSSVVPTGDNMNMALWIGMMLASVAVMAVVVTNRRKFLG
jgi:hypothetical protein